jgi:hypothetical protein
VNDSPTAFLYDIHGNLVALEAVLADAEAAGATSYLLGGDYSSMGPWPRETAELLEGLPARVRIRGNAGCASGQKSRRASRNSSRRA